MTEQPCSSPTFRQNGGFGGSEIQSFGAKGARVAFNTPTTTHQSGRATLCQQPDKRQGGQQLALPAVRSDAVRQ